MHFCLDIQKSYQYIYCFPGKHVLVVLKEQTEDEQNNTQEIRMKEQQDLEKPHKEAKVQNKFTKGQQKQKGYFQSENTKFIGSWDRHVHPAIFKMDNKDLLYSTYNSAQGYVAAWMGVGLGNNGYLYTCG